MARSPDLRGCYLVPRSPELLHRLRRAQRDASVGFERRKGTPDGDVPFLEVSNQAADGAARFHHDEVGRRGNCFQLSRRSLAQELVAVGGVALDGLTMSDGIIHGSEG